MVGTNPKFDQLDSRSNMEATLSVLSMLGICPIFRVSPPIVVVGPMLEPGPPRSASQPKPASEKRIIAQMSLGRPCSADDPVDRTSGRPWTTPNIGHIRTPKSRRPVPPWLPVFRSWWVMALVGAPWRKPFSGILPLPRKHGWPARRSGLSGRSQARAPPAPPNDRARPRFGLEGSV